MRHYIYAILLLLFSTSNSLSAQEISWDESVELKVFEECYRNSSSQQIKEKCNYIKHCIAGSPKNSSNMGMSQCALKGYKLWDAKLNSEYKLLIGFVEQVYGESSAITLRKSQRTWITYRDSECDSQRNRFELVGAVAGAMYRSCLSRMTSDRTIQFKYENVYFISKGYKTLNK